MEKGSDARLVEAVNDPDDITAYGIVDMYDAATEDALLAQTTPAEDEPGAECEPRPPAGTDADSGYDPLPPA
jgi:hypothetical protein